MLDGLNALGLPAKYAIINAVMCVVFLYLLAQVGWGSGEPFIYVLGAVMAAIFGAMRGYRRKQAGLKD